MAETEWATIALTRITCGQCGIVFAVPDYFNEECRKTGKDWYCPNGHCRVYRESDVEKLERQLQRERQRRDQAEADVRYQLEIRRKTERRLSATQGVVTRTKNRIAKGICPCCRRHFKNLHQHMAKQHPDYAE